MAYKPVDRSFTSEYLDKQHEVMKWLFWQGLKIREIREFSLGNIDEDTREAKVIRKHTDARYYSGLQRVYIDSWEEEIRIKIAGSGHEHYLLKEKFRSSYLFTREKPRSWRKELAKDSLYSLSEVKKICKEKPKLSSNVLTFRPNFGTISITKLNITNPKARS